MSKRISIIAITRNGARLGNRLLPFLSDSELHLPTRFASEYGGSGFHEPVADVIRREFSSCRALVLIMAMGIAVRSIAPKLKSKHHDPAVVVVNEAGKFVVSLLSGHHGANALAKSLASYIGAQPVITTASEASGTIAVDLLGQEFEWEIENESNVTSVSAALVNGDEVGIYQDAGERDWWKGTLPQNVRKFSRLEDLKKSSCRAALIITDRILGEEYRTLKAVIYRPKSLVIGIGCNRGTSASQITQAVNQAFREHKLSPRSINNIATIDLKQDEAGLLQFASDHDLPVELLGRETLKAQPFPSCPSAAALKAIGILGVAEPAALLSSGAAELAVPKMKLGEVTVAVARRVFAGKASCGKLFLVGIGPGDPEQMTFKAREVITLSDVIVGYKTYIKPIEHLLSEKEVVSSGMGREVERMKTAISLAAEGQRVAVVCGGDAGIYSTAGLVGEIVQQQGCAAGFGIEVIPGVPSLCAAAALLGAPMTHDFAAISLSDRLVSWQIIARRLHMAAEGDFVIVLHNPKSGGRQHQLTEARAILLQYRTGPTPVGIVDNAYREGQKVTITDLEHMLDFDIGMSTIVIVGNSTTFTFGRWMVTPRGYGERYRLA